VNGCLQEGKILLHGGELLASFFLLIRAPCGKKTTGVANVLTAPILPFMHRTTPVLTATNPQPSKKVAIQVSNR
jgi:hypothetical protein